MPSFLQQLRLLLWKNVLGARRHPIWSCALIIWPLAIFIILAIVRYKFPPEQINPCYLAPRNLPSTGLLPFLQTILCASDSVCKNVSYGSEDNLASIYQGRMEEYPQYSRFARSTSQIPDISLRSIQQMLSEFSSLQDKWKEFEKIFPNPSNKANANGREATNQDLTKACRFSHELKVTSHTSLLSMHIF
ncbi:glucosylceramide transporter ABCA12-like [Protopterus annectens]|uniref:glucosylceramide transporter ABCA12-like n=1 Tax=Protopterus annectens TaxID=7888 RepID=UPI001CF933B4|nr:glucosylceramide transporter ABCA12-like [Protopterus annectens]